jgi:protein TonB
MGSLALHSTIVGVAIALGIVDYLLRSSAEESEPLIVIDTQLRESPPLPMPHPRPKDLPIRLPDKPIEIDRSEPLPETTKPREEKPELPPDIPLKPIYKVLPKDTPPSAVSQSDPSPLRVLEAPRPEYPLLARRRGWQGIVEVEFTVLPIGRTDAVKVLKSCGYWALDEACLDAIRRWRYAPHDRGSSVRMTQAFEFRLE